MGKALGLVVGVVLIVYAIFDLIATPSYQVKLLPKPIWFLIVLIPFVGALLWIFAGHARQTPPTSKGTGGWSPPPGPRGPDDDPDYLRGL